MTLPPLPDLPEPLKPMLWQHYMYTAEQMRDYARAALAAVPAQPVAWIDKNGNIKNGLDAMSAPNEWFTPLYAAPQAVPVPAGWVMVPVKPTQAMRDALRISSRRDYPSDELCNVRYAAMLAAAPKGQP